jgi:DNA-binding transcriptional LysR family regulator
MAAGTDTRQLKLTAEGAAYDAGCVQILADIDDIGASLRHPRMGQHVHRHRLGAACSAALRRRRCRGRPRHRRQSRITVDFNDGFGECPGCFLRQIVSDAARDDPVRIFTREFFGIGTALRVRCAVGVSFKGNR